MPAWIHDRAEHLLAKNPSMSKSTAFAVATQQSHKLGKTPKGYGTAQGKRAAKKKYDRPKKKYVKGANPGKLESPKMRDKEAAKKKDPSLSERFGRVATKATDYTKKTLGRLGMKLLEVAGDEFEDIARTRGVYRYGAAKAVKSIPEKQRKKLPPEIRKLSYRLSQYSGGPANNPPGYRRNPIPPFVSPSLATKRSEGYSQLDASDTDPTRLHETDTPGGAEVEKAGMPIQVRLALETLEKRAYRVSQYSGPLSHGRFKMVSGIPSFVSPGMQAPGQRSVTPWMKGQNVKLGSVAEKERKYEEAQKEFKKYHRRAVGGGVGGAALGFLSGTAVGVIPAHFIAKAFARRGWSARDARRLMGALAPFGGVAAMAPLSRAGSKAALKGVGGYGPYRRADKARLEAKRELEEAQGKVAAMGAANAGMTPAGRLANTQRVGAPKTTNPSGPSIADYSKPVGFGTPLPGATKTAVVKRLVRIGATDVPGTPRLVMRRRSSKELRDLQETVGKLKKKHVSDPIRRVGGKVVSKLPKKAQSTASKLVEEVAENPVGHGLLAHFVPIPIPGSGHAVITGGTKLMQKALDRAFPLAS